MLMPSAPRRRLGVHRVYHRETAGPSSGSRSPWRPPESAQTGHISSPGWPAHSAVDADAVTPKALGLDGVPHRGIANAALDVCVCVEHVADAARVCWIRLKLVSTILMPGVDDAPGGTRHGAAEVIAGRDRQIDAEGPVGQFTGAVDLARRSAGCPGQRGEKPSAPALATPATSSARPTPAPPWAIRLLDTVCLGELDLQGHAASPSPDYRGAIRMAPSRAESPRR